MGTISDGAMRRVGMGFLCGMMLLPTVAGWSLVAPFGPQHRACSSGASAARQTCRAVGVGMQLQGAGASQLYADQERVIVARGELEAEMMPAPSPLEAAKRGSAAGAGGGGFGAVSSSKKGLSKQHQAEAKVLAKELRREGVIRIDEVLSDETADALLKYVTALRVQSTDDVESGRVPHLQRFADVLLKTNRCDLTLPLDPEPLAALAEVVLGHKGVLGHLINALLGKDAVLYELSTLISDPGSQRQVVHPDTPYGGAGAVYNKDPVLFTTFVALQDVRLGAPTVSVPVT